MHKLLIFFSVFLFAVTTAGAQVTFRTEYIGKSAYKDVNNKKNGGRGDAIVYTGSAQLPLSLRPTDDGRIKAWGLSLSSSYTSLRNNSSMDGLAPGRIFDNRLGILHISPLREKWSVMATVGAGIYAAHTRIGKTRFDEVLFDGAFLFVWHLRHNLDLGFGAALNSSFGYPMGFPAFYIKWSTSGKYFIDLQFMDGANLSAGVHLTDWLDFGLVADMNGSVALQKIEDKKMMFSHSYITVSLQPEFRIGKNISLPLRAGFVADRPAYYEERTLKAFFKSFGRDYDPHYQPALYLSAGLKLSF